LWKQRERARKRETWWTIKAVFNPLRTHTELHLWLQGDGAKLRLTGTRFGRKFWSRINVTNITPFSRRAISCDTFGARLESLIALMSLRHARISRRTFRDTWQRMWRRGGRGRTERHYLREHSRRISTTVFTRALTYCRRERSHKGEITWATHVKISYGGVPLCPPRVNMDFTLYAQSYVGLPRDDTMEQFICRLRIVPPELLWIL